MRILLISYPLLPVSEESCGGAEQMLWTLERELRRRGHDTSVAACDGSQVNGRLVATGPAATAPDSLADRETEQQARVLAELDETRSAGNPFDLIHDESGMFWRSAASRVREPVLATLHLPLGFYGVEALANPPASVTINLVSDSQRNAFASEVPRLGSASVIQNGVALDRLRFCDAKDHYLLWLGRICEEKGTHLAIEVAEQAGLPLIIAGQVYPFSYHQQYFAERIAPKLGPRVRFVDQPAFARKRELLSHARALLVPTLVDETSSLVAMEAMACGTPVVAFRRGALSEVVQNHETGFLVDSVEGMLEALTRVDEIAPHACRAYVEQHFSAARMTAEYESLYVRVLDLAATRAA